MHDEDDRYRQPQSSKIPSKLITITTISFTSIRKQQIMLRSAANLSLRQSSRVAVALTGRPTAFRLAPSAAGKSWLQSQELRFVPNAHWSRAFSSQGNGGAKEESSKTGGDGDDDTKEIVLTPGQQVVAVSRLGMWAGIFGLALVCGYYIAKELIPTKMSPNAVFNRASAVVRSNTMVTRQYGDSLKFYGKDHGGHREGRRNFIEHTEYTNEEDGSKRTRVRFNMEGQFNNAFCFVEVSSEMASGEFVYILVQDKRTGRVITVADNRAALTAQRMAGGNKDTANAMQQLLGGASKSG
jgi:import inner membrane translocase subunit TIM21